MCTPGACKVLLKQGSCILIYALVTIILAQCMFVGLHECYFLRLIPVHKQVTIFFIFPDVNPVQP